jgi:uncharacterized protein YutE (UPF0331/DUF86 family)
MSVRPDVVRERLAHLAQVLKQLERLRSMSPEQRTSDPLIQLAAERALQVAAEVLFDVGHHVLAGRGARVPAHYRDVLPALASIGVVNGELVQRLHGLAGLRNIIVHDYVQVDPAILFELIDQRLSDLQEAARALAAIPELR